ncbi:MAG TPA: hypothetical protein VGV93_08105 [Acidimicrobiales bacterium]|nr:hypothetical protein [Acidimicrobiales bacterium]
MLGQVGVLLFHAGRRAHSDQRTSAMGERSAGAELHVIPLAADQSGGGPDNWAPAHRSGNSRKGAS